MKSRLSGVPVTSRSGVAAGTTVAECDADKCKEHQCHSGIPIIPSVWS